MILCDNMKDIVFVSIVVLLCSSYCLTQTSQEYFHNLGDNIILLCPIQKETNPINWNYIFNTTTTIQYSTDNRTNPHLEGISERLSIVGNYDLRISTIQEDDEGTYQCSSLINGIIRKHLAISKIVRPPTDILIQNIEGGKVSGTEGQDLSLNCIAVDGKPPPEVKLTVSGIGVSVTGNQSIQYTNSQVTRDFDKQTITCSATHSGLSNVLKKTATVYLYLKPLEATFSQTSISTEETIPLTVSCTSEGSRPPASFKWYIGSTNVTTFAKDTSSHIQPADTYTVHSTLTYPVNRSSNTKEITCKVTNIADVNGTQERRQLDVKYAPDITVNSPTYTQNGAIRSVTCNPSGNPDSYTYHKWQHKSRYGELIREFDGSKTLILPDAPLLSRYQDSGEYICTASNGIKNNNKQIIQAGSGYVIVKANPVFTTDTLDRFKQFGEFGKAVEMYVNVYSVPKFTSYLWECDGNLISHNSAKFESSSTPTIVVDKIQGKDVQLDGYNVTLFIRDLKADDFANYTVTLKSGFADVRHTIILEAASVPETPGNFSKIATSTTTITVQWDPNSSGGYKQTFYIQYRVQGLLKWRNVSAGKEDINELKRRRTYELRKLREGRVYELRMFSENTAMKRSNVTDILIVFTDDAESTTSSAVIGPVVGVVVTLVIVCGSFIAILLIKRRQGKDKKEKNTGFYENSGFQNVQTGDEYEEVVSKSDTQEKQTSKTYEALRTKEIVDVDDDLENSKGLPSSKSTSKTYESLGTKDAVEMYDDLNNHKGLPSSKPSVDHYEALGTNDKPNVYEELENQKGQAEKVYVNEAF